MTGVETIARIRFEHFQNGKGIKRIARSLASRATRCARCSYKRDAQPLPQARALGRGADGDSRRRGAASAPRSANDAAAVRRAAGVGAYGALDAAGLCEALRQAAVRKKPSRPTHFETLILRPACRNAGVRIYGAVSASNRVLTQFAE